MAQGCKDRYFPVDIIKIKEYGIEKWRNDFFWPVSDSEFFALYEDISASLRRYITTQPEEIGDIFLIQRYLVTEYLHFLHALKVIQKIGRLGMRILYTDHTPWYKKLTTDHYPAENPIPNIGRPMCDLCNYTFCKNTEITIKKIAKNVIYNSNPLKCFKPKDNEENALFCGSVSSLTGEYIKKAPYYTYFTSPSDWLPKRFTYMIPNKKENAIKEISRAFADELRSIAVKNEIEIFNVHIDHLRQMMQNELIFSARILGALKDEIKMRRKKIHLLTANLNSPFIRALSIAVRRQGGRITSFSHGGHIGLFDTPTMAFSEFALSDEFITYTTKSIELFEKIKKSHKPLRPVNTVIKSADSNEYYKWYKMYNKKKLPKEVKKVMMVGYLYTHLRKHLTPSALGFMQLDLELRIIDLLKDAGYEVFYKAHPENLPEVESIFKSRVKVLKGYLEDYLSLADAFIFTHVKTTAFPITLCTNKLVIAFCMAGSPIRPFPEPMELLKKRCDFVNMEFNGQNRVIFDEGQLLSYLSKNPQHPNNEFMETYLFPEKAKREKDWRKDK
ncbi:MAG: hypothetical protein HQ575_01570 [Candidatus Omnitrophica bacterium]|nr:hypothetical protein [Candidatus Omnitrophota bacterium]